MHRLAFLFTLAVALRGQTIPDAGLLGWQERWDQYLERTYSWKRIGVVAAETAFDQTFQFSKCGRPPYCFPHQFGGALARRTARTTIELGIGALLHEDIRRRPSGLTGFQRRFAFALTHAVLARGPGGEWRPAYSRFAGTFGATAVYSAWHGKSMAPPDLFRAYGWSVSSYFQDSLFTEFEPDMRRIGQRAWKKVSGSRSLARFR